jgi:hypothetical protein
MSINIQPRNEEASYGHSLRVGGNLLFQSTSFFKMGDNFASSRS